MNTNTKAPFPNLFNAAREMIAERLEIIRNDKHGFYTQEDLESAERGSPVSDDGRGLKLSSPALPCAVCEVRPSVMTGVD